MKAYVFPGQGAQFVGMGQELYSSSAKAKKYFDLSNEILGFNITDIMFGGTDEQLKETKVTQPAVFIHSVVSALVLDDFAPDMVAGHSLGEFSALVAAKALSFEDGLRLVSARAFAMQKACEETPSTMAAILGLEDKTVENICKKIENVIPANYNCPGQLVISGGKEEIQIACNMMKEAGAKRALILPVGGAFHSPYMRSAKEDLEKAIKTTKFNKPICPIYQNVDAKPYSDTESIKNNLIAQLSSPVLWTQTVMNMSKDGATEYQECGPGKVLTGLIKKILQ